MAKSTSKGSLNLQQIFQKIKNKDFAPIYFLMGEEPYYIDKISSEIEANVLTEDQKGFDQLVVYGKDTTIGEIISAARRYPLMSNHQLIIVKEAQELSRTIEELTTYLENIQPTTILVICYKYKTIDKRKKTYKKAEELGVVFESNKLRDYQIVAWIKEYVASQNYTIDNKSAEMLAEFLGTDLGRIVKEIEKLQIIIPQGAHISPDDIERNVGISKEFNNFELKNAIALKNKAKAYKIAYYFAQNPKSNPMVLTLATLYGFFATLLKFHGYCYDNKAISKSQILNELKVYSSNHNEFIDAQKNYSMKDVSRILGVLREFDVKSKGVGANNLSYTDLINEMLAKILN